MSVLVVDASVVVGWFVPEVHSDAARRWLDGGHDFVAPDLLFPETANAIWKRVRRGELSRAQGRRLVTDISRIPVETVAMRPLMVESHTMAVEADISVYDATYLLLAVRLNTQLITGDERLARSLSRHAALSAHVRPLA